MKDEIIENIVSIVCDDIKDTLLTGIDEYSYEFPCVQFIVTQKENQVNIELDKLIDQNHDDLYKELISYLSEN